MSPLFPIPIESFGGLDLVSDPTELGFSGAIDMLDVDVDRNGRLRSRDLFSTKVANTGLTSPSIVPWIVPVDLSGGSNTAGFIVSDAGFVRLYQSGGSAVAAAQAAPARYLKGSVQAFGTPTTSYLYLADQGNVTGAGATIRRLTITGTISAPAGMPQAAYLSRTPVDNRLVAAHIHGNPHRVQFSNAGDAETWGANDYVDLDPGDGEFVTGAVTYRDLLFVFKLSKFYVFYGNSTDSSGNPIFNYRAFRTGVGASASLPQAVGRDGVYFLGSSGSIWRSAGGAPVKISEAIDPMFAGVAPSTFSLGNFITAGDFICSEPWVHTLWQVTGTAHFIMFSYHTEHGYWKTTDLQSSKFIAPAKSLDGRILVAGDGANAPVYIQDPAAVSDTLATPNAYYQSGFDNLAPPRRFAAHYLFGNTRKRFRKWKVTGSGNVTLGIAHDMGAIGPSQALTLGVSPAIKEAWFNKAVRGQLVSYRLSSTTPFSVNKITSYLAGSEPPLLGDPSDA